MPQHTIGLVIGRFQPFHKGHLYLLQQALKHVDKLAIGIGSSNVMDDKNPFSFHKRKEMLEKVLQEEGFEQRVTKIIPLPDNPSDDVWLRDTLKAVEMPIDLYIGNDEWTTGIFKKAGYQVLRIPYFKRELYEGTLIRAIMKENKEWKERVPKYLTPLIQD